MSYPIYYVEANDTLPILFDTFDGGTGASITMTGLAVTDIEIYKDGSVTQRSSDSGYTLLDTDGIDFDGITGIHGFSIDLSDNTDAGFYAVGSWYHVVVSTITVDAQTVSFIAAAFRIVSATRGMAGTALPDAAADAAGGLPISDAGGLDLDTMNSNVTAALADTNELQGDWTNTGRLDTILDTIAADVVNIDGDAMRGTDSAALAATALTNATWTDARAGYLDELAAANIPADLDAVLADTNELQTDDVPGLIAALNNISAAEVNAEVDTALGDYDGPTYTELLNLVRLLARSDAAVETDLAALLTSLNADLGSGAGDYSAQTDSGEAIRDRGDAAWTTGGGGALTQVIKPFFVVPTAIDLANTATVRFGIILTNAVDDLPTAAEITPGTITISRKAIGGTSWTAVVSGAAMSEQDGMVYYDEVFDSGSGYAEGDSIRVQFESVSVTADANTFNITGATGVLFQTFIRETERGTDSAALASDYTSARAGYLDNLNIGENVAGTSEISGLNDLSQADVRTAVGLAAANLDTQLAALPTAAENRTEIDSNSTQLAAIVEDTGTTIPAQISGLNDLSAAQVNAEADTALADFFTSSAQLVDDIWDELLTGATHNISTSAGRRVRELAGTIITGDTCQAGSTSSTVVLASGASAVDGAYDPAMIAIVGGTGVGQSRMVLEYAGSTRTATVDRDWKVTPDATSQYIIYAHPGREHVNEGLAQGGASGTITLNALASSHDSAYNGQIVFIRAGTGADQVRLVTAYNGTTKVATVDTAWDTTPDTSSAYVMLPNQLEYLPTILADTNELQGDWANGGRLDLILDELTTQGDTNEGKLDTAQADLDVLTGADGVTLATLQPNYAPNTTTPPTVAAIRSEMDANSTQLAAIVADTNEIQAELADGGRLDLLIDAILADTNELQTDDIPGSLAALNDISVADLLTTAMTESYAAEGAAPTLTQAVMEILQFLKEKSVSGTTVTTKKLDQLTTAATYTLDDGDSPTSITRAT